MKAFSLATLITLILTLVSCTTTANTQMPVTETPTAHATQITEAPRSEWVTRWPNQTICAPPCWEGIEPGKTSLEEAEAILKKIPVEQITDRGGDFIEWKISDLEGGRLFANAEDKKVFFIRLSFHHDQKPILHEVINVFGHPAYIQIICGEVLCDTDLIYPDKGMSIGLYPEEKIINGKIYEEVTENSTIYWIQFFIPGIDNFLKFAGDSHIPPRNWTGYGLYALE